MEERAPDLDVKHPRGKHHKKTGAHARRPFIAPEKGRGALALIGTVIAGVGSWRRRARRRLAREQTLRKLGSVLDRVTATPRRLARLRPTLTRNAAIAGGHALASFVARRIATRRRERWLNAAARLDGRLAEEPSNAPSWVTR